MTSLFLLDELSKELSAKADKSFAQCTKFMHHHLRQIDNIKSLVGKFPGEDDIYFLYTMQSFNAFTFIPYIIRHSGRITNLSFSTYSINERIVNSLIRWHDKGEILNIHIVIADSIRNRMPKVVDLLNQAIEKRPGIIMDYAWNHSKITLIESAGNHFVIEGSGNFSENAQFEQYVFINNKNIYEFRDKCLRQSIKT